ncbi:uncharacterized protein isoform X3 [Takifugu rubripes]|uniref:uncharacterized protein isoform X3 n=1 Tax=Takifugu rubripes TaxID=31033 RepID=UPI0011452489|nr:uncharacterized protein LOC105416422 isoform X3 [Takifugu rubripes]
METTTVYTGEMTTAAGPTVPPPQLTSEQITVVAASFFSLVFFVVVLVLISIIYNKDPHCCKARSCRGQRTDMQAAQLFYVGLPSSYSLPSLEAPLPRLPSYESVRKKDRQRQIHMMIADRFGLNGPIETEPPPTYEESIRQSVALPCDILSGVDTSHLESFCSQAAPPPGSPVLPV